MRWPYDARLEPGRRQFYCVHQDLRRNPSDYEVLNSYVHKGEQGWEDKEIRSLDGGHLRFESKTQLQSFSYGLPRHWSAVPKVKVALKNRPLDSYGFHRRLTISDRAKQLLRRIDEAAFEFMECNTSSRPGLEVDQYWLMDCAKVVDRFDQPASTFAIHNAYEDVDLAPISLAYDIHWHEYIPENTHAFIWSRMSIHMIWDEILVDAWRAAKFTGLLFQPMQPPLVSDRKSAYEMSFGVRTYWTSGAFRDYPKGGVRAHINTKLLKAARG